MSNSPYSKEFYEGFDKFSLDAARIFLGYLFAVWTPKSVIDVGCGNGTWLAACHENGVKRLVGLEGEWVTQDMMPSPTIELRTTNLRAKFVAEPHDLTISMEVAEHLPPESSDEFFHSLVQLSDAVLFSAAFAGQPGTDHINTRLHSLLGPEVFGQRLSAVRYFPAAFLERRSRCSLVSPKCISLRQADPSPS